MRMNGKQVLLLLLLLCGYEKFQMEIYKLIYCRVNIVGSYRQFSSPFFPQWVAN